MAEQQDAEAQTAELKNHPLVKEWERILNERHEVEKQELRDEITRLKQQLEQMKRDHSAE